MKIPASGIEKGVLREVKAMRRPDRGWIIINPEPVGLRSPVIGMNVI